MSLTRALIALALVAAPAVAHAQFVDRTVVVPPPAEDAPAEDARPPRTLRRYHRPSARPAAPKTSCSLTRRDGQSRNGR